MKNYYDWEDHGDLIPMMVTDDQKILLYDTPEIDHLWKLLAKPEDVQELMDIPSWEMEKIQDKIKDIITKYRGH